MKLPILALLCLSSALAAQTLTVSGPSANIKAGGTYTLTVAISGVAGSGDVAAQFSLTGIAGTIAPATGTAAAAAGKSLTCAQVGAAYNCVVVGGSNALADGALASLQVTLPKSATGAISIAVSNPLAAAVDASGFVFARGVTAGSPFVSSAISVCDLNGDGKVDSADLAASISQALGVGACVADLDGDGKCNIVDVQIVGAAASGGICAVK